MLLKFTSDMANNFDQVFEIFKKHYEKVPLEFFKKNPYKTLISTMMSSRTKDDVTLVAAKRLFNKAPTPKALENLRELEIRKLIYPVGFYKTKAKQLKVLANIINSKFKGNVPNTRGSLTSLPGVGRKTANLVLNRAYDIPAIAVDTHVHKISNLLGWVKTKTPEQTEKQLNKLLPKKYWSDINRLFVSIGRQHTRRKKLINFLRENNLLPNTQL